MIASFVLLSLLAVATTTKAGQFSGGIADQPVDSPEVQDAAHFAIQAYNKVSDSLLYSREVKLLRAQTQIVSGIMYILTVELADTECQKSLPSNDLEKCQIPPGATHLVQSLASPVERTKEEECEFKVWSQPWLKPPYKLISSNCKPVMA